MSLAAETFVNENGVAQGLYYGDECKRIATVAPTLSPVYGSLPRGAPPPGLELLVTDSQTSSRERLAEVSVTHVFPAKVNNVKFVRLQEDVSTCGGHSGSSASVSEEEVCDEEELADDSKRSDTSDTTPTRMDTDWAGHVAQFEAASFSSANHQRTDLKSNAKPFVPRLSSSAKPFVPHGLRAGSQNLPVLLLQTHLASDQSKQAKQTPTGVSAGRKAMAAAAHSMESILQAPDRTKGGAVEKLSGGAKKVPRFCGSCGQARDINNPGQRFCGTCGEELSV